MSSLLTRARWAVQRRRNPQQYLAARGAELRWTVDTQLAHLGTASPARHRDEYGFPNRTHDPHYLPGNPCACAHRVAPSANPAPARVELVPAPRDGTLHWWRGDLYPRDDAR